MEGLHYPFPRLNLDKLIQVDGTATIDILVQKSTGPRAGEDQEYHHSPMMTEICIYQYNNTNIYIYTYVCIYNMYVYI